MSAQENLLIVLPRMIELVKRNKHFAEYIAESLDIELDVYAEEDGFGTEQQSDPRGDFRSGPWSITTKVQK